MIPVFCERKLIGFLRMKLDGFEEEPYRPLHAFAAMPSSTMRRMMTAKPSDRYMPTIEVEALTIFDNSGRPVAIEVRDESVFAGWGEFVMWRGGRA